MKQAFLPLLSFLVLAPGVLQGGPWSGPTGEPAHLIDAPIPGFVGPQGAGKSPGIFLFQDRRPPFGRVWNFVNPLFFGWAAEVTEYHRADGGMDFNNPGWGLGEVTGEFRDVVSLGELDAKQLLRGDPPGSITLRFDRPIRNLHGADFAVFENGFVSQAGGTAIFAELAHVEVSLDGAQFRRFPSRSQTPWPVGEFGMIDATEVYNLAGKHANARGESWGTPFDLDEVGLEAASYVRLVDIPGNGSSLDAAGHPIYDPWPTVEAGGFDLEAIGAISQTVSYREWPALAQLPPEQQGPGADPDGDGLANLLEYATGTLPWRANGREAAGVVEVEGGQAMFTFVRDERVIDLMYFVQTCADLVAEPWETVAISQAGGVTQALSAEVDVREESASEVRSVGVLRRVRVRVPAAGRGFFRLRVAGLPPP